MDNKSRVMDIEGIRTKHQRGDYDVDSEREVGFLLSIIDKQKETTEKLREQNESWKRQFESEMEWLKPNLTLVRKEDEPK